MKVYTGCFVGLLVGLCCEGAVLQLQGDKASLRANQEPLRSVLASFEAQGIRVVLDPTLAENKISGEWNQIPIARLVEQLAYPNNYVVSWKQMETPLGILDQMSRIVIMGEGEIEVEVLTEKRKTLDVVQAEDGSHYIRGEILVLTIM